MVVPAPECKPRLFSRQWLRYPNAEAFFHMSLELKFTLHDQYLSLEISRRTKLHLLANVQSQTTILNGALLST